LAVDALEVHFPRVAARLRKEATDDDTSRADLFLGAVERRKGVVAQELLGLTAAGRDLQAPPYIRDAIIWLTEQPDEPATAAAEPAEDISS
jgi:hypothetical protein